MTTQTEAIKRHLSTGKTLTALDALKRFNCLRLAARILDLRQSGFPVSSRLAYGRDGKRYAEYWMTRGGR